MFRLLFLIFFAIILFYIIKLIILLIKGSQLLKVRNPSNKSQKEKTKIKEDSKKIIDADYEEIQ